jgi:hypothetical protein
MTMTVTSSDALGSWTRRRASVRDRRSDHQHYPSTPDICDSTRQLQLDAQHSIRRLTPASIAGPVQSMLMPMPMRIAR